MEEGITMNIEKINIENFGKLNDVSFYPSKGLNIIFAPNESGKTTLLSFIKFIFYGSRTKKYKDDLSFKEKYTPWNGSAMSGSIEFEHLGKKYIIYRNEGGNSSAKKLEIRNAITGDKIDISDVPGKYFFSMGEKAFSDSCFITDTSTHSSPDEELIAMISQGDDGDVSYNKAKDYLQEKLASLSSSKRSASTINVISSEKNEFEVQKLNCEKENADICSQIGDEKKKIDALSVELKKTDKMIDAYNKSEISKQYADLYQQLKTEEEILEKLQAQKTNVNEQAVIDEADRLILDKPDKTFKSIFSILTILAVCGLAAVGIGVMVKFDAVHKFLFTIITLFIAGILIACDAFSTYKFNLNNTDNKNRVLNKYGYLSVEEYTNSLKHNENSDSLSGIIDKQMNICQERINTINIQLDLLKQEHDYLEFPTEININNTNHFTKSEINDIIHKKDEYSMQLELSVQRLETLYDKQNINSENQIRLQMKLEEVLKKEKSVQEKIKVLNVALHILDSAFSNLRDSFAPGLSKMAYDIIKEVSPESCTGIFSDESLNASVKIGASLKDSRFMSRGTRDLIYISLRLSICKFLSKSDDIPAFFDDIFAFFDDERCNNILSFIYDLSSHKQIFLCTCRKREVDFYSEYTDVSVIDV